jgi:hypothetical protein
MGGDGDDPMRDFADAWDAAASALGEWAQRVGEATTDAVGKLDPAIRAMAGAGWAVLRGGRRDCLCLCSQAHPDDVGVCDGEAVMTRRLGSQDVPLCAPCAVAQGVAEMSR